MTRATAWFALFGLLVPALTFAGGGIGAAKRSIEAGMVVTGDIEVNPDGSVRGYSLDQSDKLPAEVRQLIGETVPHWKFVPIEVDGRAVLAKVAMSLRVVARPAEPGKFVATVDGAEFGITEPADRNSPGCADDACLAYRRTVPPRYPIDLVRSQVGGTAYVAVKVDRNGRVADAAIRQVNLGKMADATRLARWQDELGKATQRAVREWTFNPPKSGVLATQTDWDFTMAIGCSVSQNGSMTPPPAYGQWSLYIPGPQHVPPWEASGAATRSKGRSDAIPDDGQLFFHDARFVLRTPLSGTAG